MSSSLSQLETSFVPPAFRIDPSEEPAIQALQAEVRELAAATGALLLAHNYQAPEVQDVAHFVGDSLGLAIEAQKDPRQLIVFCGVHFMAESAKVMSPDKTVLLPSLAAGCSLADSISAESLAEWKEQYPDHTVVTYVNSSAEVKALSDICCTSANAISVVRSLDNDKILFTPDRNLGRWVAKHVPDKDIVIYDGCCPTHDVLRGVSVEKLKEAKGNGTTVVIAHPECREDVIAMADEVCSTSGMMDAVARHPEAKTFLVATEWALIYRLKLKYPHQEFVPADGCIGCRLHCPYMKAINLDNVKRALTDGLHPIDVPADVIAGARRALERMIAVPRDN